jgi:hypothetical protein
MFDKIVICKILTSSILVIYVCGSVVLYIKYCVEALQTDVGLSLSLVRFLNGQRVYFAYAFTVIVFIIAIILNSSLVITVNHGGMMLLHVWLGMIVLSTTRRLGLSRAQFKKKNLLSYYKTLVIWNCYFIVVSVLMVVKLVQIIQQVSMGISMEIFRPLTNTELIVDLVVHFVGDPILWTFVYYGYLPQSARELSFTPRTVADVVVVSSQSDSAVAGAPLTGDTAPNSTGSAVSTSSKLIKSSLMSSSAGGKGRLYQSVSSQPIFHSTPGPVGERMTARNVKLPFQKPTANGRLVKITTIHHDEHLTM